MIHYYILKDSIDGMEFYSTTNGEYAVGYKIGGRWEVIAEVTKEQYYARGKSKIPTYKNESDYYAWLKGNRSHPFKVTVS